MDDVICIESSDEETNWPVEALDEYADIIMVNEQKALYPVVKEEKEEKEELVKPQQLARNKFSIVKAFKNEITKEEEVPFKKLKKDGSTVKMNFDFPKKCPTEKNSTEISIEGLVQSITDKFHRQRQLETIKSKVRIICAHLLLVKEQYRTTCLIEVSNLLDEYKK